MQLCNRQYLNLTSIPISSIFLPPTQANLQKVNMVDMVCQYQNYDNFCCIIAVWNIHQCGIAKQLLAFGGDKKRQLPIFFNFFCSILYLFWSESCLLTKLKITLKIVQIKQYLIFVKQYLIFVHSKMSRILNRFSERLLFCFENRIRLKHEPFTK